MSGEHVSDVRNEELADSLVSLMGFGEDLVIRWKPHMWWVYNRGSDVSHFHGMSDDPEALRDFCQNRWPSSKIEIDYESRKANDR